MVVNIDERSPRRRDSLARLTHERIKNDILDQRLLPRQPLVEAELATEYQVSKTPVREALLTLAREGLVELNAFRGGRVRDFTADDAREIYKVRELLEPFALEQAAPHLQDDLGSLRSLLDEARVAAESGDRRRLSELNRGFHDMLVAQCGNGRVIEILDRLQDQVRVISLRFWNVQASYLHEAEQHAAILDAVEAGYARKAAELLRLHIVEFKERYVDTWER